MKKIFGFLLAVCVVAMLVVTPIGVAAEGNDCDIDMGESPVVLTTPGDINDDDAVNLKDLVALAQAQADWNIDYRVVAADTNGDGTFDLGDVTHLAQYLAGWGVELNTYEYVL